MVSEGLVLKTSEARIQGIGDPMTRLEDRRLVRGLGSYGADQRFPGEARMAILRSPYPHAAIRAIRTEVARALPGVAAVLTAEDACADGLGYLPTRVRRLAPDGRPNFVPPFSVLAAGRVRHVGDAVAAVIAETIDIAKDALELIEVEYEALPAVTDTRRVIEQTAADPARTLWPEAPGNICFVYDEGDRRAVERAFAAAAHVATVTLPITRVSANPLEPRNAAAMYDEATGRYTLYAADQSPHVLRNEFAEAVLKIDESRLRIVTPDCGGSFGMKYGPYPEQALALWAARRIGRPVRWVAERSESFLSDHHARDNVTTASLALDADGKFLALKVDTIANLGAYLDAYGTHSPTNNVGGLAGTYTTPHIAVRVTGVFSNTNPTSAYRGAGRPEASYAIERVIDAAAADLGVDRVELRRRNMIPPEGMPFKTGLLYTYDSGEFERNMDRACALADWDGFESRRAEAKSRGRLRGIGIASVIEIAGGPFLRPAEEYAEIRFDQSGSAHVLIGTTSQGQGHETTFTQVIGEFLGLPPQRVRISFGDTDQVAFGRGTFGSRVAAAVSGSLRAASDTIIDRATDIAAHLLEVGRQELEFAHGRFTIAGTDRSVDIVTVARAAFRADLLPPDFPLGLSAAATVTLKAPTFPNGCHVCEVEIDPATGALDLLGYWVVDDVGRVLNPTLVKGQMMGGIVQGLGQAMGEEVRYDGDGQLVTGSFQDYCMPRADHVPPILVETNEVLCRTNPLGIKGVGEAGTVGALPVLMSAVNDALLPLGIRHFDMPASPARLWAAIQAAKPR